MAGAADVAPEAVLGKPSQETVDMALARVGVPAERCLMVGDRLDTDVAMGARAGMRTALVLTGVSEREDVSRSDHQPDRVLDGLADVEDLL